MIPEISTRGEEVAVAQNSDKSLPKIEQLEIVEKSTTESVLRPKGDRPSAQGVKPEKFKISEIRGVLSAPRSPPRSAGRKFSLLLADATRMPQEG